MSSRPFFYVINTRKGHLRCVTPRIDLVTQDASKVRTFMLGRLFDNYIVVKSDDTGDRVVPLHRDVLQIERNCIDA